MLDFIIAPLLWFCALGCALVAGLFFAFSAFIMTALGRIEPQAGIAAMNAINSDILRSFFMPVFLGTTLASATLAVLALLELGRPGAMAMLAGGAVYVLGMFIVTMAFNVPLNNKLAAADPAASDSAPVWTEYVKVWTSWNHARTLASIIAVALFIAAIAAR